MSTEDEIMIKIKTKHEELKDRASLKDLVNQRSILGDRKDFHAQVQLFSENAVSETYADGKEILNLKRRKEMA